MSCETTLDVLRDYLHFTSMEVKFLFHLTTVEESHRASCLFGLLFVVSNHYDGASVFLVQFVEEFHHFGTHLRVEVTRRFVGKDDFRIAHDGTGDGHTLALTTGELCWHVLHTVAEAYTFQYLLGKGGAFRGRHLAVEQRKLHIVDDVERIYQVEALEYKAERLVTERGQLLVVHAFGVCAVDFDGSRSRRVEQAHNVEQGGLSAS